MSRYINTEFRVSDNRRVFLKVIGRNHTPVSIQIVELDNNEIIVHVYGQTKVAISSNIGTITPDEFFRMEMEETLL